jgi:hypothetical protein
MPVKGDAAVRLAGLLAKRGEVERAIAVLRLRECRFAAGRPAGQGGDVEGLRQRADAEGDKYAASRLAELLAEGGDVEVCGRGRTPATETPLRGWPSCWPSGVMSRSAAEGRRRLRGRRLPSGQAVGRAG